MSVPNKSYEIDKWIKYWAEMGKENAISGVDSSDVTTRMDESNDGLDIDLAYADVANKRCLKMPIEIAMLQKYDRNLNSFIKEGEDYGVIDKYSGTYS